MVSVQKQFASFIWNLEIEFSKERAFICEKVIQPVINGIALACVTMFAAAYARIVIEHQLKYLFSELRLGTLAKGDIFGSDVFQS